MGSKGVARTPFGLMGILRRSAFGLAMLVLPFAAQADSVASSTFKGSLQGAGAAAGLNLFSDPATLVAGFINAILGLSGIVLMLYIVYAGILYTQAGMEPDKAKQAKTIIINSVIGIVIVLAAYVISNFVVGALIGAVKGTPGGA